MLFQQICVLKKRLIHRISVHMISSELHTMRISLLPKLRNNALKYNFYFQSPSKVLPSYAASNLWRKPAVKKSCEEDGSISHLKEFFAFENSTDSFSQEKVNSDSRNVETLAKSLTFVCAAVILLYLSKDYKYPIGIKVSQCTTTSSENSASKIDNNHVKGVDFRRGKLPTKHCFPRDGKDSISLEEAISKSQIICKRKKVG